MGPILGALGSLGHLFGSSGGRLASILEALGVLWAPFWVSWGSFWGVLRVLGALCGSEGWGPFRAALGRSWASSWVVLGANLEPRWPPRERQKRIKMFLKIKRFFDTLLHLLFFSFSCILGPKMRPCWHPKEREKSVVNLKTPICI